MNMNAFALCVATALLPSSGAQDLFPMSFWNKVVDGGYKGYDGKTTCYVPEVRVR
jgi:opacity protein-like surface antigen